MFDCNYCKGKGHFKQHCLKLLTKNCPPDICRDFNRFQSPACTVKGSCCYNRRHICLICYDEDCKASFHVSGHTIGSLSLPKKHATTLAKLVEVIKSIYDIISTTHEHHPKNKLPQPLASSGIRDSSTPSSMTPINSIVHEEKSILALPVVCADRNIKMPVATCFPVSSVSLEFAKEIMTSASNNQSIEPLDSSRHAILSPDGSHLRPCGTITVPLKFPNAKVYRFQMLVIPQLQEQIIFGKNHLSKTAAEISTAASEIHCHDPNMNFTAKCCHFETSTIQALTAYFEGT